MPDQKDPEQQLKELQETIRLLSLENETLAERAEDAALLGLIAEKISSLEDPKAVIDTGLEQISLLKDIPLCACCSIVDGQIRIESYFVSFSDAALEGISLILPATLSASRSILLTGDDLHAANLAIGLPGKRYEPASLLLVHFENVYCPVGFFVFADNGRLVHCETMLLRVTELLAARISIIRLISELRESKEDLDRRVEERTQELSDAYRELEQEMAERVTAQENLQDAEAKYRNLTENSRDMIYRMSLPDGVYEYVSPASTAIFGYSPDEFYNTPVLIRKAMHPDWRDYFAMQWEDLLKGVMLPFYEYQIIQKSGEVRWLNQRNVLIRDEQGSPVAIEGIVSDITERMNAERALRDSEEKYRTLFEESQDIVFISTHDGKFVDINPAGVSRLRYASKEELMSVVVRDIYAHAEDRAVFLELLHTNGFVTDFETTVQCRDKQLLHITMNATAIRDDLGNISLIRGIARDITEHRKLEEQLRQAQKMESIGNLAGGVAHDFNNILTAIIGYGHLAMRKMERDDPNRLNIEQMLEAADRAAHLTKDLLLFSRKQPIHRKLIDLNEVIRKLEKFLIRVIGEDIALQSILHDEETPILADTHQIEQVLMNLATNARDAMPKGGALTVAIDQIRLDQQFINLYGYGKPGVYAMVTVSDTGEGMDEQTRQKIFEPFYTTKEVGKGTGLGLAVVYGIVRQHEGYINVDSEPGIGTAFRIYLPIIATGAAVEETTLSEERPEGGTETILLAEDNESVRNLTLTILKEFGYTVITAVDGEDAVNKYRENKESIQLLLFDLIMPKKSGKEAYEEIRKIRSEIKILFASGYSPDIVRDKASLGNGTAIIFKPASPMELLKQVRMVLDKG